MEVWISPSTIASAVSHMIIIGKIDAYYLALQKNTGRVLVRVYNGFEWVTTTAVTATDTFTHIALTYDQTVMTLYINGESEETRGQTGAINIGAQRLFIGDAVASAPYSFPGTIGEVRIYNRALTPQEIQQNYLATQSTYH